MKILVTGSAGFIGYHLSKALINRGDVVVGLDNINNYYSVDLKFARLKELGVSQIKIIDNKIIQSNKYENFKFIKMDLENNKGIDNLFESERFDKVCNLAAQAGVRYSIENPHAYINSNILGFLNILESSKKYKIKHLVYASSSSVYGNNTKMPLSTSDEVDHPISLYAATKKSNELFSHTYSHLFDLPTTGLIFFTVYGPWGRPDMALFLFTEAIFKNKPIKVFNYGNMVRDFTYVGDVVEGVLRVIDNPPKSKSDVSSENSTNAPYKIYNIGNSSPVLLIDYIKEVENNLGKKAKKKLLPIQMGDVPRTEADVSDLVRDLKYKPSTTIKDGIKKFTNWYLKFYK